MPTTRKARALTALVVLGVSGVALAPVSCATSCSGSTDGSGACVTACDTVLGYPAPWASGGWLAVPAVLLLCLAYFSVTRPAACRR